MGLPGVCPCTFCSTVPNCIEGTHWYGPSWGLPDPQPRWVLNSLENDLNMYIFCHFLLKLLSDVVAIDFLSSSFQRLIAPSERSVVVVQSEHSSCTVSHIVSCLVIMPPPRRGAGALSGDRHPSSVCLSDVAYIGSNSKTKRPTKTKLCTGVPQVTCDSHTDFKVKRSKVNVGRGHIVAAT